MNRRLALCLLLSAAVHLSLSLSYVRLPQDQILVSVEYRAGGEKPETAPAAARPRAQVNASDPAVSPSQSAASPATAGAPVLGSALGLQTDYPKLSRILREEGEVLIRVADLSVVQSSGHPRLDEAAQVSVREGISGGRIKPETATEIRFIFKLRDALDH